MYERSPLLCETPAHHSTTVAAACDVGCAARARTAETRTVLRGATGRGWTEGGGGVGVQREEWEVMGWGLFGVRASVDG
jgi:hypothetical protein